MRKVTLNNVEFDAYEDDAGEFWFQARRPLHYQTLKKAIKEAEFMDSDLGWVSHKDGCFSVKGDWPVQRAHIKAMTGAELTAALMML